MEQDRVKELKQVYRLEPHPEGGWFAEMYTAPFLVRDRPTAGSIYFLLEKGDISHFHQIDCDEIWYYHEGCGMKITVLRDGMMETVCLGAREREGQRAAVMIPKGAIFAAENLDRDGYTFLSCATTPQFTYAGFRLVGLSEIRRDYPKNCGAVAYLAMNK
ncbi:MAG: cupin domain-containing protein [Clostridia bacterium]|nr:cupin domain-containing protein [Clostridia bacterium]